MASAGLSCDHIQDTYWMEAFFNTEGNQYNQESVPGVMGFSLFPYPMHMSRDIKVR